MIRNSILIGCKPLEPLNHSYAYRLEKDCKILIIGWFTNEILFDSFQCSFVFVSGTTRHLTAAESADAIKAQVEQVKEQVQQQAAQLKDQGSEEVNTAMNDLAKKCGPNANTVVDDQCYASCSGSFNFDGSTCTCNGSPCESWKVGETGPTSTSSDSTNAPALATAVSSSGLTVSPMFFLATSLVLLVQIAL